MLKKIHEEENISKAEKKLCTIINIIAVFICIICLIIIIKSLINPNEIPSIFGYKPIIVLDDFGDTVKSGDLVFISNKVVDISNVNLANVVSYKISNLGNIMLFLAKPSTFITMLAIIIGVGIISIKISDKYDKQHAK